MRCDTCSGALPYNYHTHASCCTTTLAKGKFCGTVCAVVHLKRADAAAAKIQHRWRIHRGII